MHAPAGRDAPPHAQSAAYVRDPELNLLSRAGFDGIPYSDGAEAEARIHAAMCGARDRGTFSVELARAITDWPSEYHLSRERHCVVRPLGIRPGEKVLELGCGCGAITRYLGEIGADVTAVEGAPLRARTAAERCRDLANVTVVTEDFLHYATEERFDWVLLIGVLEYAPTVSDEDDPVARMLHAANARLAPGGRLVVAIENKLGLKYFNGCAEDHLGVPFYGVQGLYGARTPRTFGRGELARYISNAGLPYVAFHYPFPDYKLPRVVLSEEALHDPGFDAAGTLASCQVRDYGGNPQRLFDDALVAREATRNGVLADLSNSFLVVAAREPFAEESALAMTFAVRRNVEFVTQTRFVREGSAIRVQKQRLCPQRAARQRLPDGSVLEHIAEDRAYVPGSLALETLSIARARHGDLAAIVAALTPWFEFLLGQARPFGGERLADFALPGSMLDATPFNLVETPEGLVPIDMEWRIDRAISLGWVVARSVLHCLRGAAGFEGRAVSVAEVIETLCAEHSLAVDDDEIDEWLSRERELQRLSVSRAPDGYAGRLLSHRLVPVMEHVQQQGARIAALTQTAAELTAQIDLIHRSRSWRYSYPIRLAGRLFGRPAEGRVSAAAVTGAAEPRAGRLSALAHGLRGPQWDELRRYGVAFGVVIATFMLTRLMIASGIHVPRMLLYIAAVAIAARVGGLGPGVFATVASVAAIWLPGAQSHLFAHNAAFAQRLALFLVCAIIGIVVSAPMHRGGAPAGADRRDR